MLVSFGQDRSAEVVEDQEIITNGFRSARHDEICWDDGRGRKELFLLARKPTLPDTFHTVERTSLLHCLLSLSVSVLGRMPIDFRTVAYP